jgi:hypothetical protein
MARREREKRKRDVGGDGAKERGEPGGADPGGHPYDHEVHPADESARQGGSRRRPKKEGR